MRKVMEGGAEPEHSAIVIALVGCRVCWPTQRICRPTSSLAGQVGRGWPDLKLRDFPADLSGCSGTPRPSVLMRRAPLRL